METNGLIDAKLYHSTVTNEITGSVSWDDPRLAEIIRFRLLSDPGFPLWDVSYCHGRLRDGSYVNVTLPFSQLPKRGWRKAVVEAAKKDGVWAKGLGIFDNVSTLN